MRVPSVEQPQAQLLNLLASYPWPNLGKGYSGQSILLKRL